VGRSRSGGTRTDSAPLPDGAGAIMDDRVEYALPLAPVGEVAHFVVRRQLDRIFDYRRQVVAERFG